MDSIYVVTNVGVNCICEEMGFPKRCKSGL